MRIALKNVTKKYGDRIVLNVGNSFFDDKKIYAILGPNGSGKTSLLRILAGVDKAFEGEISYFPDGTKKLDNNLKKSITKYNFKDEIAYLPQKPYIFKMSALKNACLGADLEVAKDALKRVGMDEFCDRQARTLSGGEAQRVAIARTLATRRKLIFLDEPMAPTDIGSARQIESYIKSIVNELGATVIFTTHSPQQALHIADEALILLNGSIVESGEPHRLFSMPQNPMAIEFIKNWRI